MLCATVLITHLYDFCSRSELCGEVVVEEELLLDDELGDGDNAPLAPA